MPPIDSSTADRWRARLTLPELDTREGVVLAFASTFALVYIVVLVAAYNAMTSLAFAITGFSLLASLIPAFALGTMLGDDITSFQRLELELARTVLAYVGSGSPPPSDAPLAGVWRAHVAGAEESRRMARTHAYALGFFTAAGAFALAATLLSGLGAVMGVQNVSGLGMFVEWFAFTLLAAGAGSILASVGYASSVPFYDTWVPRRWRRNAGRQKAVDGAVTEVAWLAEFARGARDARISPAGPSMIPSWRE